MSDVLIFGAQRDIMLPAFHALTANIPCVLVRRPEDLSIALLERVKPRLVVLPDWSWIVPDDLLARATFIGFHASALPDYRGGSPLQHQILDGLNETKLTMFRMAAGLDNGPILLDAPLSLAGTISEIWQRIAALVPPMVTRLLHGDVEEKPQPIGGFVRKRRTPDQSELTDPALSLSRWYDMLRALDDPYPNAFVRVGGKRIAFRKPRLSGDALIAEAVIREEPSK
ncbi:MAG: formyltransferase family protein [Acidobacteriota bacterium]